MDRLREIWETITARRIWLFTPDGDDARKARNTWSSMLTTMLGQPGFFEPNVPNPWLSPRGAKTATCFYSDAPLRETLLRLVDFDLLNSGAVRFAAGAVNVVNGNFVYFDNTQVAILPEHVMASGALPPALPMVRLGSDYFWDGGLVSNTPLQHLLDHAGNDSLLVFQVDLFSAQGALPRICIRRAGAPEGYPALQPDPAGDRLLQGKDPPAGADRQVAEPAARGGAYRRGA